MVIATPFPSRRRLGRDANWRLRWIDRDATRAGARPCDCPSRSARRSAWDCASGSPTGSWGGSWGRSASTIQREVARNGGRARYRAWRADERALRHSHCPRAPKLAAHGRLRRAVERGLNNLWSPQQIANHLARHYPGNKTMAISHETIYQALLKQGRGSLRKELTRCLRTGRAQRRLRGRKAVQGQLTGMVLISERPAEVDERAVPDH